MPSDSSTLKLKSQQHSALPSLDDYDEFLDDERERPDFDDELDDELEFPPYPLPAAFLPQSTKPKTTLPDGPTFAELARSFKPAHVAHASTSSPAERPDPIPFEQVEVAAFKAFNHKGGEIDLECGLEVHQRGDQADAAVVAEVIIPKVDSWQVSTYGRVILGQAFTSTKVVSWCRWWIFKHLRSKASPPKARKRGYTASQAQRGRDTQTRRANDQAAQAQALRLQGLTCTEIAARLGRGSRCIRYAFKRFVDPGLVQRLLNGVQSVKESSTGPVVCSSSWINGEVLDLNAPIRLDDGNEVLPWLVQAGHRNRRRYNPNEDNLDRFSPYLPSLL